MTVLRLIDTSVWIGALDRQGNVAIRETVRGMLDRSEAVICSPVVFEVLRQWKAQGGVL